MTLQNNNTCSVKIVADYHMHTSLCGHATGEMHQYVKAAIKAGLQEICFTDHSPLPVEFDKEYRMKEEELPIYVASVLNLASEYKDDISIKLGIEADYYPGYEEYIEKMIKEYPFDCITGSIHYIDSWGFDNPDYLGEYKNKNINDLYVRYYEVMTDAVNSGMFDIISHPDLVKKFGHRSSIKSETLLLPFLKSLKSAGLSLEVNTSGLRKPVKEVYPNKEFLKLAKQLDISVIVGSDAHCPNEVGFSFAETSKILQQLGYDRVAVYNKRKKTFLNLASPNI